MPFWWCFSKMTRNPSKFQHELEFVFCTLLSVAICCFNEKLDSSLSSKNTATVWMDRPGASSQSPSSKSPGHRSSDIKTFLPHQRDSINIQYINLPIPKAERWNLVTNWDTCVHLIQTQSLHLPWLGCLGTNHYITHKEHYMRVGW